MKKTIITLMALAGVAAAEVGQTPLTLVSTFKSDKTATTNYTDLLDVDDLKLYNTETPTTSIDHRTGGSFMTSYLRPNSNVDSAAANSWTLDFTLTNSTSADFTVDSITLSVFAFDGGGNVQANNRNFLFTVSAGETTLTTEQNLYIAGGTSSASTLTINLSEALAIATNDSVDFKIVVGQGANSYPADSPIGRGSFVGLEKVTFTGTIPEPTTATLSLLALAGLTMRRRRK